MTHKVSHIPSIKPFLHVSVLSRRSLMLLVNMCFFCDLCPEAQPLILKAWPLRSLQRAALLGSQHTETLVDGGSTEQPLVPDAPHHAWLLGSWERCLGSVFSTSVGLGSNLISYSDSIGTLLVQGKRPDCGNWHERRCRSRVEWDKHMSSQWKGSWFTRRLWASDSISLPQCLISEVRIKTDLASKINLANYCNHFYNWIPDSPNSIQSVGRKESPITKHFLCVGLYFKHISWIHLSTFLAFPHSITEPNIYWAQ